MYGDKVAVIDRKKDKTSWWTKMEWSQANRVKIHEMSSWANTK